MGSTSIKNTITAILILLFTIVILRIFVNVILSKLYRKYLHKSLKNRSRIQKRLNTFIDVLNNLFLSIGIIIGTLLIISNFINIQPIVASAGILGIGVSLGAQSLFRDLINGILFLVQDQFGVGDIVQVGPPPNGIIGTITEITLRTITVRDFSGNVTTFPNGGITQITNFSKEWSMFSMQFMVNINSDIDKIIEAMQDAGQLTEDDPHIQKMLLDKTNITGIESFGDGKMNIGINIKTFPGKNFEVGRKYRYNLKKLIEERNISI